MQLAAKKQGIDRTWWFLIAVLVLNAILKWKFFSGLCQADDFSYGVYSYSFFLIPLSWDLSVDFRALRLAMLLPVTFLFRIFSPSEFIAVLYPLMASFAAIVFVFLIGRKLAGDAAGLFSACALATFPGDVIYGTMLLPDVLAPFFLTMAVWAFLNAESGTKKSSPWWFLAAGVSVFLAFNARENSYYFLLFFLPFAFNLKRWKRGLWMAGAGFAVMVILLYSVYAFKSGDFLYNLHLAQHQRDPLIQSGYIPPNGANWYTMFRYMFPFFFPSVSGTQWISSTFGITFYLGVPLLIYTAIKGVRNHDRRLLIAPWWFLLGYLFIEYGSVSFTSYHMMQKLPRFLLTITPPLAIGYGVALADVFSLGRKMTMKAAEPAQKGKKEKKSVARDHIRSLAGITMTAAILVMGAVLVSSGQVMGIQSNALDRNMAPYRWAYQVLKGLPHKPIYQTGGWWNNKLSFYFLPDIRFADMGWRRSNMLRDLMAVKNSYELAASYVVLDRTNFSGQNDLRVMHSYDDVGPWALAPPEGWKLLGQNYGVEIYDIPAGWTWSEHDGKELIYNSMRHALKVNDYVLFLHALHPDFVTKLNSDQFYSLFAALKENSSQSEQILGRMEYREYNGTWKLYFTIFQ